MRIKEVYNQCLITSKDAHNDVDDENDVKAMTYLFVKIRQNPKERQLRYFVSF